MLRNRFKFDKQPFEQRLNEYESIKKRYPDRIPVIVEKHENSKLDDIDKSKYLVPYDLTFGQFMYVIRKRLRVKAEQSLFLMVNDDKTPSGGTLVDRVYEEYKSSDGFLKIKYMEENVFG